MLMIVDQFPLSDIKSFLTISEKNRQLRLTNFEDPTQKNNFDTYYARRVFGLRKGSGNYILMFLEYCVFFNTLMFSVVMGEWILLNLKLDALHSWHGSDIILVYIDIAKLSSSSYC